MNASTHAIGPLLSASGVDPIDTGPGLLIECSGRSGSVAIATGGGEIHEISLPRDQATARTIAPAVDQLLKLAGLKVHKLAYVALTVGPGSFTGLRIGAALARSIGFAAGIPLAGVSSLQTLAVSSLLADTDRERSESPRADVLFAATNAFRQELFVAAFRIDRRTDEALQVQSAAARRLERESEDRRVPIDSFSAWLRSTSGAGSATLVSTEPPAFFRPADLPEEVMFAQVEPRAITMLPIVVAGWPSVLSPTVDNCLPVYLRGSAAEERKAVDAGERQ